MKSLFRLFVFAIVLIQWNSTIAKASTIVVNSTVDQRDSMGDCTLRDAVRSANTDSGMGGCNSGNGVDTIQLPAGVFTLTLSGNDNTAYGGDLDLTASVVISGAGSNLTVINANRLDRIFHSTGTAALTIQYLTLSGGTTGSLTDGGAIYAVNGLTLTNVIVSDNLATRHGGAIHVNNNDLLISNSQIISNSAGQNGGGANVASGKLTLNNSQIISNSAAQNGGAAYVNNAVVAATSSLIERNTAGKNCGGLRTNQSATLTNTTMLTNTAVAVGGGFCFDAGVTINGGLFRGNQAGAIGGAGAVTNTVSISNAQFIANQAMDGAALYTKNGPTRIHSGTFELNVATSAVATVRAGGTNTVITDTLFMSNTGVSGNGVALWIEGNSTVNGGLFRANSCSDPNCGGAAIAANSTLVITKSRFFKNQAQDCGGAIRLLSNSGATAFIANSIFANNRVTSGNGAAVCVDSSSSLDLRQTTIASSELLTNAALKIKGASALILDTIISGYSTGIQQETGNVYEDYNLFYGVITPTIGAVMNDGHSVVGNPSFVAPASDNYRLTPSSAAIDYGTNAGISIDFDGTVRPQTGNFDIGAFEATTAGTNTDLRIYKTSLPTSGDATHILFQSNQGGNFNLFRTQPHGSQITQLTSATGNNTQPAWSPDGSKILFVNDQSGNPEIFVMNADGSNPIALNQHVAYDGSPTWSPDGTKIAFTSERDGVGNREIYVMNVDGSGQRRVTDSAGYDDRPSWSPNSSRIAFSSARSGNREIYTVDPDGTGLQRLTNDSAEDDAPMWSPNGQKIAFVSTRGSGGDREIYLMNSNGSSPQALTNNTTEDRDPAWFPDATKLIFTRLPSIVDPLNADLFTLKADGSSLVQVTGNGSSNELAVVRPLALAGWPLTYTLTINNAGSNVATNVMITDTLPLEFLFLSLSKPAGWACSTPPIGMTGLVVCNAASIAANSTTVITVVGSTLPGTPVVITNTAQLSADNDITPLNNNVQNPRSMNVATDLALTKLAPLTITSAATLNYTIVVSNVGGISAQDVTVVDELPTGLSLISCTASGVGICSTSGRSISVTYPALAVNQQEMIHLQTVVALDVVTGTQLTNSAVVHAATLDLNTANNRASTTTVTHGRVWDVRVTQHDSTDPIATNSLISYTVNISNAGPSAISNTLVSHAQINNNSLLELDDCTSMKCPSVIAVTGIVTPLQQISVTLTGFDHPLPEDVDIILVSPNGVSVTLMSDVGGDTLLTPVNLVFDDNALQALSTELTSGTYRPTNAQPEATDFYAGLGDVTDPLPSLSRFLSLVEPNGPWSLYAVDETYFDTSVGSIAGWSLSLSYLQKLPNFLVVTNTLPTGFTFVSASSDGWGISHNGNAIVATRDELEVGVMSELLITATTGSNSGLLTNTATAVVLNDINPNNNTAHETTLVIAPITGLNATNTGPTLLGGTTILSASVLTGSNITYVWNFGDGSAPAIGQSIAHLYPNGGTFMATVTASNYWGTAWTTTTVEINLPTPTPTRTPTPSRTPTPTLTPTQTMVSTQTETATLVPTDTPTATETHTPTSTITVVSTETQVGPSTTPKVTVTATLIDTPVSTATLTPTATPPTSSSGETNQSVYLPLVTR